MAPAETRPKTVLVTGSTGHLGSWLVMRLLQRGYSVRAAVLDPLDENDLAPIVSLPGAADRLEIFQADLATSGAFDAAAQGCDGVFHLACNTNFAVDDPQKDVVELAVQGTLNVLRACAKSSAVKRVVHASSAAAVRFSKEDAPGLVFDESRWTNVDACLQKKPPGWPYFVGKTLGEKAAIEFAEQNNLDLVTILPVIVHGPFLISRIPNSVKDCLALITGENFKLPFMQRMSYVHTDDVVNAFIFLYENPAAKGRHICSAVDASIEDVAKLIASRYPEFNVPTDLSFLGETITHYMDSSKLKKLGFELKYGLEEMFDDAIKCCRVKNLL